MILADKIIYLRKKAGYSQEELANEMNVSRQSISKWEGALSIPDMDKILMLSTIFNVSTDFLLKDEIYVLDNEDLLEVNNIGVTLEIANDFIEGNKIAAKKISFAVALFILSPVAMFIFDYLSLINATSNKMYELLGFTILISFVAAGILLCISTIPFFNKYRYLEKSDITLMYGVKGIIEKQDEKLSETIYIKIGLSITLILFSVIPAMYLDGSFVGSDNVSGIFLLSLVAIAVFTIVYNLMLKSAYDKLLQVNDYTKESKKANKLIDVIAGPYWIIATGIYLLTSFTSNQWGTTWIIWPIAGILFGAIAAILNSIYGAND